MYSLPIAIQDMVSIFFARVRFDGLPITFLCALPTHSTEQYFVPNTSLLHCGQLPVDCMLDITSMSKNLLWQPTCSWFMLYCG